MKTCRDTMRESNDNLSWCRPESYLNGRVILAINEGRVDVCQAMDEEEEDWDDEE